MDHFRRLGNSISIPIPTDENAFTGRECPRPNCEGYFKIELGTGLKGEGLPCCCVPRPMTAEVAPRMAELESGVAADPEGAGSGRRLKGRRQRDVFRPAA